MKPILIAALLCATGFGATLRIACGGPGGIDSSGAVWVADSHFSGGTAYTTVDASGKPFGAMPYDHMRTAPPGATIYYYLPTVAGSSYTITLHFLDPRANPTAGQRIFSVWIADASTLMNVDLSKVTGSLVPKDYVFQAKATGESIRIAISSSVGNSIISGIEATDVAPVVTVPPASTAGVGLLSARPKTCVPGQQWMAVDTDMITFCKAAPNVWSGGFIPVGSLQTCVGQGVDSTGKPWNCAGLLSFLVTKNDGTTVRLTITTAPVSTPGAVWSPIQ